MIGILDRFKQFVTEDDSEALVIYAPISGEIVKIEDVPDVVFSEKILGDGIAIRPTGNRLLAPIHGTITKLFDTHHAFVIESEQLSVFVHFGVNAVKFHPHCFTCLRFLGDEVACGDPIIEIDLSLLPDVKSLLTPVIVSNIDTLQSIKKLSGDVDAGLSPIMVINP